MSKAPRQPQELLTKIFTVQPEEAELYKEAFIHSSNDTLPNNQRLAFLGDSVLRLIVREHFYKEHPEWDKNRLTRTSEKIELGSSLAEIAIDLKMVEYMDIKNPPADFRTSVTLNAQVFEALFGAIYLNRGFEEAKRVAKELLLDIGDTSL